jgi:hypothetical protein
MVIGGILQEIARAGLSLLVVDGLVVLGVYFDLSR